MVRETDLIKERLDLADFLRSYLKLLPAGRNLKALCPFHPEKTPSFIVSPDRKIWHCFGCGLGGDIIGFVMRYENFEFPEALRFLAERAGLPLKGFGPGEEKQFSVLYEINEAAARFFAAELPKSKRAEEYLLGRGLKPETIKEFGLGFAPGGETLTLHLISRGYDVGDIVRAGLANKNVKGLYRDKFEGRIVFPLWNNVGKIVAFTGRLLPGERPDLPKYLNSPETPIFSKSKLLYGLSQAKQEILKSRTVLILEGQLDFLLSWQAGVRNIVATSGTALTREHLLRLKRLADAVVVSFDNDEAGYRALERALDLFNDFDLHVKALDLGEFKDPAEAVVSDPAFLAKALLEARPVFTHLFSHSFSQLPPSRENDLRYASEKKRLIRSLLAKIKKIKSRIEQGIWLKELSRFSGVSEIALLEELENLPSSEKKEAAAEAAPLPVVPPRIDLICSRLLSLAFLREEFLGELQSFREWLPPRYDKLLQERTGEEVILAEMRAAYEFADKESEVLNLEFKALLRELQIENLRREMESLREEIRLAQAAGKDEELTDIMVRFSVVAKKMSELTNI